MTVTGNANENSYGLGEVDFSFGCVVCVMARSCAFLLLAVFAAVICSVFCKDLQPLELYRKSLSKLESKILSNRAIHANTLRSDGETLNNLNDAGK